MSRWIRTRIPLALILILWLLTLLGTSDISGRRRLPSWWWAWVAGSETGDGVATHGAMGVPDRANAPGARRDGAHWRDREGRLWLFGGFGLDEIGIRDYLGDLWSFDGSTWGWRGGESLTPSPGGYDTVGVVSASNFPGGRAFAAHAASKGRPHWLFGGVGHDSASSPVSLGDLWQN